MILIGVLAAVLLFVAIFFWGSIASGFSILGLLMIPGILIYKRLWIDREDHDFGEDDPMNMVYRRHYESVAGDDEK